MNISNEAIEAADNPTLTDAAVSWFCEIAEDAERDIALLPESSQPFWFRARTNRISASPAQDGT